MKPKVGIIGRGKTGSSIQRGLERASYQVKVVGNDPKAVGETAAWADLLILAIPFVAIDSTVKEIGHAAKGKAIVDITNVMTPEAIPATSSGAKELQKKIPDAHIVKAFNTVFAEHMDDGHVGDQQISLFIAGDSKEAKAQVLQLARDIGFDAVDAGPLDTAKNLENMGNLIIQICYRQGLGRDIGFKLVQAKGGTTS
jgi:8-hydroxy-5-deazaflavin:NADPH oxidoreductase